MDLFALVASFAGGFAVCYFFKDAVVTWWKGAAATVVDLEAKAAALKAKL
jgi:hypothetical protein